MAASASSAVGCWYSPMTSLVSAGFLFSNVSPELDSTQSPSMKLRCWLDMR